MTLYDKRITTVSLDTLKTIADMIDFPVCVCGGWAVYFTVNEFFKEKKVNTYCAVCLHRLLQYILIDGFTDLA
jgi:hypothetical protein